MQNFLIGKLLRWIGKRLDGYRTVIGGVGMILSGIVGLLGYIFPDNPDLPKMDLDHILAVISGGFIAIGLGGKAEKVKNEIAVKSK